MYQDLGYFCDRHRDFIYMKNLITALVIITVVSLSCDKKTSTQEVSTEKKTSSIDTLKIATPSNLKPVIPLTKQAKEGVLSWTFYNDLAAAIDSLNVSSLNDLKARLVTFDNLYLARQEAQEAEVSVAPEFTQNNAIKARLLAIETKVKVLKNNSQLNSPDANVLSLQIGEVKNAHQNLKLQLNELFDTSFKDLLEEIKLENENAAKRDSISNVQDQFDQ